MKKKTQTNKIIQQKMKSFVDLFEFEAIRCPFDLALTQYGLIKQALAIRLKPRLVLST